MDNIDEGKSRPGRKIAAERRRIARAVLREFYKSPEFEKLPGTIQLAMKEICPVRDSHPSKEDYPPPPLDLDNFFLNKK